MVSCPGSINRTDMCRNYFSRVLFSISLPLFSSLAWADQATNLFTGTEYLRQNAEQRGVIVTRSGLQYEILQSGHGATPSRRDRVVVHYRGTFIDGKEFDYTVPYRDPRKVGLAKAIPGWIEGLQLMKTGGKAKLVIPPHLGYGRKGKKLSIPGCAVLVFEIELIGIESAPATRANQ